VLLFYADKLQLLSPATIAASTTYEFIKPVAPFVINAIGVFIPWFKDMFTQLESFFAKLPVS
jgi:membrane protein required for colicin V production